VGTGRDCGGWGGGRPVAPLQMTPTDSYLMCALATSSLKGANSIFNPLWVPQNSASKIANFRSACAHNPFYQL